MIETFKKWFGKKEEEKVEEVKPPKFDYVVILAMKDGSHIECLALNWLNPDKAHTRIIDLLEEREWFGTESLTGEKLVIKTEDVDRATVKPEPFRPSQKN